MNNPLVSIIVPFYNPEFFFDELLSSICNQSYKNIEVILVDDGSDKHFNSIAQNFAIKSPNTLLITQKNAGVASARQTGLDASSGDYVIYADADDLLPQNAIEILVTNIFNNNADIVIGGFTIKYQNKDKYAPINVEETYWSFVEGLIEGKYHGSLCNKLIKRELYKDIFFEPNLNYMEDKLVLAKILLNGPYKISFVNEPVYVYRQNSNSVTYNLSKESIESSVKVVNEISKLYKGVLSNEIIDYIQKKQRAFEIFQYAKKGINIYQLNDLTLIFYNKLPLKYKVVILLLSINQQYFINKLILFRSLFNNKPS